MNARWSSFVGGGSVVVVTLLTAACAAPSPIPMTTQPALSAMAQPYADGLRKAGINSVQVFANSARVRMATTFGEIYLRYPPGLGPTAFAVYVDPTSVEVDSDTFNAGDSAQYEAAIKAILPAAIKSANENNTRVIQNRFGRN
jgi:hypothetical protein